jgi:asparagine synthase (glutamine-hydrolysing)
MCGIAVAIEWEDAEETVRRLLKGIRHRGDISDPVVCPARNIAMGTRRLRIVDGEHAVQPQSSFDNRILVSFNGEIYNHVELRRELEASGIVFRTESDTEVLASSLRVWGPKALERINGMYAFVAIDAASGEFLAARDPLGVKPLYLIQSATRFLFCSEIRPLLETVDAGAVLLLPPGHLLTRTKFVKFGSFIADRVKANDHHGPAILDGILEKAVHIRVPRDLPVAMMFSGGIDSTLVAHYARQIRPNIPGYFLGDDSSPDYQYAVRYADQTGFDLRRVAVADDNHDTLSLIGDIVAAGETFEPSVIRLGLCNFLLAKRIHNDGFRVMLSGEGADELFAGYPPLELAFADGEDAGNYVREQCLATMHKTNLQRLDRFGMRFQIEARQPFLDPTVIAYALSLPAHALIATTAGEPRGKAPLRDIWDLHQESLPEAIRNRRKVPLHIGSGFDESQKRSPWMEFAEQEVSDREFADGKLRFSEYDLRTKEEVLYLDHLSSTFDISRVPHLKARPRIYFPHVGSARKNEELLRDHLVEN